LRRGPYVIAAGLDESPANRSNEPGSAARAASSGSGDSAAIRSRDLRGKFVNLFDSELKVQTNLTITAGSRYLLLDLEKIQSRNTAILAASCKIVQGKPNTEVWRGVRTAPTLSYFVEGVGGTEAVVLLRIPAGANPSAEIAGGTISSLDHDSSQHLAWIRF